MNANRMISRLMRMVMRRMARKGANSALGQGQKARRADMTPEQRQQAKAARQSAKRARQAARTLRRIGRL